MVLATNAGPVAVTAATREDGMIEVTLTSVLPWVEEAHPALVARAVALERQFGFSTGTAGLLVAPIWRRRDRRSPREVAARGAHYSCARHW